MSFSTAVSHTMDSLLSQWSVGFDYRITRVDYFCLLHRSVPHNGQSGFGYRVTTITGYFCLRYCSVPHNGQSHFDYAITGYFLSALLLCPTQWTVGFRLNNNNNNRLFFCLHYCSVPHNGQLGFDYTITTIIASFFVCTTALSHTTDSQVSIIQ